MMYFSTESFSQHSNLGFILALATLDILNRRPAASPVVGDHGVNGLVISQLACQVYSLHGFYLVEVCQVLHRTSTTLLLCKQKSNWADITMYSYQEVRIKMV